MAWFIRSSYRYIAPRGLVEHLRFVAALLPTYRRYLALSVED